MMAEGLDIMGIWCVKQMQKLERQMLPFFSKGQLDSPEYRSLLGQHQAFGRMRSFIHGCYREQRLATRALMDDLAQTPPQE